MDNVLFSVNGESYECLEDAIKLVMRTREISTGIKGYMVDPNYGMVLFNYIPEGVAGVVPFPAQLNAQDATIMVKAYLRSEVANDIYLNSWEEEMDHDGSNSTGWHVYVNDWGHVGTLDAGVVCAIKKVNLWHGK